MLPPTVFLFSGWEPPNEKQYHKKFTNRSVYGFGKTGDRFQTNKRYESVITKIAPLLVQEGSLPRLAGGVVSPGGLRNQPPRPAGTPNLGGEFAAQIKIPCSTSCELTSAFLYFDLEWLLEFLAIMQEWGPRFRD